MVSVNVAQLLKSLPGAVRDLEFAEPLPDPDDDLHLVGPVSGDLRLLRTSRGVLVRVDYRASASLECARCLDAVRVALKGDFEEEFMPSLDIRTGFATVLDAEAAEHSRIDEHHEIHLDELLRQDLLTSLPLRPLCDAACPGLCPSCGERMHSGHTRHPEDVEPLPEPDTYQPFARLAELMRQSRSTEPETGAR